MSDSQPGGTARLVPSALCADFKSRFLEPSDVDEPDHEELGSLYTACFCPLRWEGGQFAW